MVPAVAAIDLRGAHKRVRNVFACPPTVLPRRRPAPPRPVQQLEGIVLISYLDESGNTGKRLDDPMQPHHYVAAVLIREDRIRDMTARLNSLAQIAPTTTPLGEYRGSELFAPMAVPSANRRRLRSRWTGSSTTSTSSDRSEAGEFNSPISSHSF